jgi:hypothetical protein
MTIATIPIMTAAIMPAFTPSARDSQKLWSWLLKSFACKFEDDVLVGACEVAEDVVEEINSELKEVVEEMDGKVPYTALFSGLGE